MADKVLVGYTSSPRSWPSSSSPKTRWGLSLALSGACFQSSRVWTITVRDPDKSMFKMMIYIKWRCAQPICVCHKRFPILQKKKRPFFRSNSGKMRYFCVWVAKRMHFSNKISWGLCKSQQMSILISQNDIFCAWVTKNELPNESKWYFLHISHEKWASFASVLLSVTLRYVIGNNSYDKKSEGGQGESGLDVRNTSLCIHLNCILAKQSRHSAQRAA